MNTLDYLRPITLQGITVGHTLLVPRLNIRQHLYGADSLARATAERNKLPLVRRRLTQAPQGYWLKEGSQRHYFAANTYGSMPLAHAAAQAHLRKREEKGLTRTD